jgi:methylated-DNA-[protein]-cysteine S-methyltransferase
LKRDDLNQERLGSAFMPRAYLNTEIRTYEIIGDQDGISRVGSVDLIPNHEVHETLAEAYQQLSEYFNRQRKTFTFKLNMIGTEFQIKCWTALLEVPYGETRSYKEIATMIGDPKASRAVGMANNRNPLAIVVPCHRVIGARGQLVGYEGGVDIKRYLLALEGHERFQQLF